MSEEEIKEMLNKEPVELLWDKIHSLQQENKELREEKLQARLKEKYKK